jgi:hypothetical protein
MNYKKRIALILPKISLKNYYEPFFIGLSEFFIVDVIVYSFEDNNDCNYSIIDINDRLGKISKKTSGNIHYIACIFESIKLISEIKYDFLYIFNHKFCFLFSIFLRRVPKILTTYTFSVSKNKIKAKLKNYFFFRINVNAFRYVFTPIDYLQKEFGLSPQKNIIVDWGFSTYSKTKKFFCSIDLLYVGVFDFREISSTILGLAKFIAEYNNKIVVTYHIIGYGSEEEIKKLKKTIINYKLEKVITFIGYVEHDELKNYFDKCNIGVSYVPKRKVYEDVKVSKTYEYLLSGMPVIATDLKENIKVIDDDNGVIINANPDGFYKGLVKIYNNLKHYDSEKIYTKSRMFSQEYVVKNIIYPNILKIIEKWTLTDL